jgi:hypothetical protein
MPSNMTGTDMRPNSDAAYDASDVVQNVSTHLAEMQEKIGSESSIPEPPASPAEPSEPTPKPEGGAEPEPKVEPTQEPADSDVSTPAEPEGAAAEPEGQQKPAIPDNYYRAAIHSGFKPEQISKLYDANADEAVEFLKQNYEHVNNLSRQFANLGRSAIELQQKAQVAQVTPAQQPAVQKQEVDIEKLKKQYEDDPFGAMFEMVKAVTAKPDQTPVEPAAQVVQPDRVAFEEQAAALQQLHQFFKTEDMEAYGDFYGVVGDENMFDWTSLPPVQLANRRALVDFADQIIAGHELQGKNISTAEGLQLAHLVITEPIREQIVREKITSQVKKRSKGITLKPSGAASTVPAATGQGGKKSYEQAEANLQQRLPAFREKLGFTRL